MGCAQCAAPLDAMGRPEWEEDYLSTPGVMALDRLHAERSSHMNHPGRKALTYHNSLPPGSTCFWNRYMDTASITTTVHTWMGASRTTLCGIIIGAS